ncbi:hypothetical protein WJX81_005598 [Elliptochloris bilobata]|uniref:Membrane-associated 30 kDa chloroplastic n=1 Tax=Elliptochloris bilobata TaxID=381761 RepID=A0AAW1QZX8_9CHLO
MASALFSSPAAAALSSKRTSPAHSSGLPCSLPSRKVLGSPALLAGTQLHVRHRGAAQATRASKRSTAAVEANLFGRLTRVVRSYTFFYGDSAVRELEDPRKLLDQAVADMQADLIKMRQTSAQVIATQRLMQERQRGAASAADEWQRRAEMALRAGDEDLARAALTRRKSYQTTADALAKQLEPHTRAAEALFGNIRALEAKVAEAVSKKETLKARAASAQATKMLNEEIAGLVSGLRSTSGSSLAAFSRVEERVLALEAEAEASSQLGGVFSNDSLEGRFALLEGSTVDDELLKLKTDLVAAGKPLLPPRASAPTRDYATLGAFNNVDIVWP